MKPEGQRIAIAEACGWTEIGVIDYLCGIHPQMLNAKAYDGSPLIPPIWEIPDYLHDLNAMHEAMKTLSPKMGIEFCFHLNDMGILGEWDMLIATAAQRAEAFLKTIGKWEKNSNES